VRNVLKYGKTHTHLPEINVFERGGKWDFKHNVNPQNRNVCSDPADAMKENPRLKVMLNGGYYDLATPFFGAGRMCEAVA
jgi:carboxypeptidase C (cathepsin A)